jgi:hypothetical protein
MRDGNGGIQGNRRRRRLCKGTWVTQLFEAATPTLGRRRHPQWQYPTVFNSKTTIRG